MSKNTFLNEINYFNHSASMGFAGTPFMFPHIAISPWLKSNDTVETVKSEIVHEMTIRGAEPLVGRVDSNGVEIGGRKLKIGLHGLVKRFDLYADFFNIPALKFLHPNLIGNSLPIVLTWDIGSLSMLNENELMDALNMVRSSRKQGFFIIFHGYLGNDLALKSICTLSCHDYDYIFE